jgi:hypothetical protein
MIAELQEKKSWSGLNHVKHLIPRRLFPHKEFDSLSGVINLAGYFQFHDRLRPKQIFKPTKA